jgi:hypothetical protein
VATAIWVFLPFEMQKDVQGYMVTLVRMITGSGGAGF